MQLNQDDNNLSQIENNEHGTNWDEASLAQLLGFNEKTQLQNHTGHNEQYNQQEAIESEIPNHNAIEIQELFDNPQQGKTQPTFYGNPFAKFGAVGVVMLVVFGAGATVLNTIMSGKVKTAPTIANQGLSKPKVEIADNTNSQETETGKLKAELALSSQAEKIKSVERSQNPKTPVLQRKIEPRKPRNDLNIRRVPRSEALAPRASISQRSIPVYRPPRPILQNYVASVPRFQPVANRVTVNSSPKQQPTDPMEEWSKINRIGSYGSSEIASASSVSKDSSLANDNRINTAIDTTANSNPSPVILRATLVSTAPLPTFETPNSPNPQELQPLYAEEAAIINGQETIGDKKEPQQLMVGAFSDGKLVTPLIWGKRSANNTDSKPGSAPEEKFIVELVSQAATSDGFAIPKGSYIVATVVDVTKSGFVQLEATQAIIDGKEYVLPRGAISIRGKSGQPLMASKWGDKGGEIAARDAETFVVGSLAKVGKVLNQPKEEQISNSSGFGGTSSYSFTRRGRSNILGAVLEGGFEPLTGQMLQRNSRALSEIQQREDVWYIREGTDVQVFVNQSFQF
jgi:Bacterial conjugation TrbI-like protein